MKAGLITVGLVVVTGISVALLIDDFQVPSLVSKVKTFCGIVSPSDDDLRRASLDVLYPKIGFCNRSTPALSSEEQGICREQIGKLTAWTQTLDDVTVQGWYRQWLKYYATELDKRYGSGESETAKREAYARAQAEERARIAALADCLPKPPRDLP